MSSWCPFVDGNLIGMRTWQCQQKDSAKQNHLLWVRGLLERLGLIPLRSALLLSLFWLLYVSLTSSLSGRTFRVCFSLTFYSLFLAATHTYSQVTLSLLNSWEDWIVFFVMFRIFPVAAILRQTGKTCDGQSLIHCTRHFEKKKSLIITENKLLL